MGRRGRWVVDDTVSCVRCRSRCSRGSDRKPEVFHTKDVRNTGLSNCTFESVRDLLDTEMVSRCKLKKKEAVSRR